MRPNESEIIKPKPFRMDIYNEEEAEEIADSMMNSEILKENLKGLMKGLLGINGFLSYLEEDIAVTYQQLFTNIEGGDDADIL